MGDKEHTMSDVETLTYNELVEELKKRCSQVFVFTLRAPEKPGGKHVAELVTTANKDTVRYLADLMPHVIEKSPE